MQAEEMHAGMYEVLPCGANGKALRRGDADLKDRNDLGGAVHWLWYLRQKVPVQRDSDHQFAQGYGKEHGAGVLAFCVRACS